MPGSICKVTFAYSDKIVLKDSSFDAEPGKITLIGSPAKEKLQ